MHSRVLLHQTDIETAVLKISKYVLTVDYGGAMISMLYEYSFHDLSSL